MSLSILVTGSNRGIGLGIVQLLAKTQHTSPLHIIAASRSGNDLGIQPMSPNTVEYATLDISNNASMKRFAAQEKKVDVLINNAGINENRGETPDLAAEVLHVNYGGTRDMCSTFLSSKAGRPQRIVNVSSTACQLSNYDDKVQTKFRAVNSIDDIEALASSYLTAVQGGAAIQNEAGFGDPPKSYQVSKALVNALTVVLAQQNSDVSINCCCPGWVDTDMGHQVGKPPKSLEEGARIPVRLAIGDLGSGGNDDGGLGNDSSDMVSGKYFSNDGVTDRGWGKALKW